VRSAKVSLRDHDYLATGAPLDAEKAVTAQQGTAKKGTGELYEYPSRVVQNQTVDASANASSAATKMAKLRMEEATSLQIAYTGTTNAYDVATGSTFELEKARTSSENTNYLVVSTEFSADFGDHEAIDDLKSIKRRKDGIMIDVVAIKASGAVFRPERITPRPLMHGPQTATVVGADAQPHRPELRRHRHQRRPVHQAVQAAQLRRVLLVPGRAEAFFAGVVHADAVAAGGDRGDGVGAKLGKEGLVRRRAQQAQEGRDLLDGVIDLAAMGAVGCDQGLVALVKGGRLERPARVGQAVALEHLANDLVDALLDGRDVLGQVVKARDHQEALFVELADLFGAQAGVRGAGCVHGVVTSGETRGHRR